MRRYSVSFQYTHIGGTALYNTVAEGKNADDAEANARKSSACPKVFKKAPCTGCLPVGTVPR